VNGSIWEDVDKWKKKIKDEREKKIGISFFHLPQNLSSSGVAQESLSWQPTIKHRIRAMSKIMQSFFAMPS
jgi:hypothetical protein